MRRWEGRTDEPLRWAVFGAGGVVAALAAPVLVVTFGLLVPLGVIGGVPAACGCTDAATTYAQVHGFLTHPVVAAVLCLALGLVLWHAAHRAVHALHDLGLHPPRLVRDAVYGLAVLVPVVAFVLCLVA